MEKKSMNRAVAASRYAFKVIVHKLCVGWFCFKAGLYWRGIVHDMSKFHPKEFLENIKFYDPLQSPVNLAKKEYGWSPAWQHHKGMNSHHHEYWIDDIDHGVKLIRMPFEDALELVCDGLGASIAYNWKIEGLYQNEWNWWKSNAMKKARMHPHTRAFIHSMFKAMHESNSSEGLSYELAKHEYQRLLAAYEDVPVSCPMEDCIWKEPETAEEKAFWEE